MLSQKQISAYLANETLLYQDWYKEVSLLDEDPATRQIAQIPSLDELKLRFQQWCVKNLPTFKKVFCHKKLVGNQTFCQWLKEMRNKIPDLEHFIVSIPIDIALLHPPHTPIVLMILVTSGCLEKLCEES